MASVSDSLFLIAFVVGTGGLKGYYLAWTLQETDPLFKREPTQRYRYHVLTVACLLSCIPIGIVLYLNGWSQLMTAINDWWTLPIIGWIVVACCWFGLISPLVALLVVRHIYRNPCRFAKRIRSGGWITTDAIRSRLDVKPVYIVEKFVVSGRPHKRFVQSGEFV